MRPQFNVYIQTRQPTNIFSAPSHPRCPKTVEPLSALFPSTLKMYLYLSESPRTLYLVTSSQDERRGCSPRALVFRASQGSSSQATVEFLPKSEVDLSTAIKLTSRIVKGCLGLISVANGA